MLLTVGWRRSQFVKSVFGGNIELHCAEFINREKYLSVCYVNMEELRTRSFLCLYVLKVWHQVLWNSIATKLKLKNDLGIQFKNGLRYRPWNANVPALWLSYGFGCFQQVPNRGACIIYPCTSFLQITVGMCGWSFFRVLQDCLGYLSNRKTDVRMLTSLFVFCR